MQHDPKALAEEFSLEVAKQTDAIMAGDHKKGNKHAKRYIEIFKTLRAMGDLGRDALLPLLGHERADIRVAAAAFLLRHKTSDAMAVLQGVAMGTGMAAFGASEAIKRWKEGTWTLDPLSKTDGE